MAGNPKRKPILLTRGALLNFYVSPMAIAHPITGELVQWRTVEHYFQSCKGLYLRHVPKEDHAYYWAVERIRQAHTAMEAKRMGRDLDILLPLWNKASFGHMLMAHIAKFSQNVDLARVLVGTGSKKLIEHRPDPIWGDNLDGTGKNYCGRSLMIVRKMAKDWDLG